MFRHGDEGARDSGELPHHPDGVADHLGLPLHQPESHMGQLLLLHCSIDPLDGSHITMGGPRYIIIIIM